jgi:hypothetical protein
LIHVASAFRRKIGPAFDFHLKVEATSPSSGSV